MRTLTALLLAPSVLLAVETVVAQTVTFEYIPTASSANDMTPDGRYVVGTRFNGSPYRYDTTTNMMIALPVPGMSANAVSDDGSVILGNIPDPEGIGTQVAAIWTEADGWQSLGALPNALGCPSRSSAYELSGDGTVAVGLSWDECSGRGFRWTEATGMVELEVLANGGNRASVITADGSRIAGFAQGNFSRTPAIWDGSTLLGELIGPDGANAQGEVHGLSDDGSILLGTVWLGVGQYYEAVKWTMGETGWDAERIGDGSIIEGWAGNAMDIADDGTIVGFDSLLGNRRAWIQPNGTGAIQFINDYVEANGGTVPPEASMHVCQAITPAGDLICGHGSSSNAWLIRIDSGLPCNGNVDGNDIVDFQDLLIVLANWGACVGCPADVDGNDMVDFQDLLIVLANWGPCP